MKHNTKLVREEILDIVRRHDGQLSVTEVGEILSNHQFGLSHIIDTLEFRFKAIYTRKAGLKRMLFINPLAEADRRLMERFKLDLLDFQLLESVNGDEPPQELAERFKAVANQIKARLESSIPFKFEVKTFIEAKTIFLKHRKESIALLVV